MIAREDIKARMIEEAALAVDDELVNAFDRLTRRELCACTSSHRNRGLTVFQITIFARSHRRVFGLARWGNALDDRVVVGLLKEGDGQALCP